MTAPPLHLCSQAVQAGGSGLVFWGRGTRPGARLRNSVPFDLR